mgnify:CR=1 FL=1
MTISEIIKEYHKVSGSLDKDCEFIKTRFTELLESLRMEEFDGENNPMLNEFTRGKNQAIQEINKRISNLLK